MPYGDLQTFLPRAEGEVLDVERARSEANARAQYLSEMDKFYESLEESARQFDIQQALAERQFEWQSGFEERRLQTEKELKERELAYQEQIGAAQAKYWESQAELGRGELELARNEQSFLQDYYRDQFSLEERRFGLEERLVEDKLGGTEMFTPAAPWQTPQIKWWAKT